MGHRDRKHFQEVYTIKQAAELSGVPENTIRSWERRFGIPSPERSSGNQRQYSRTEIDILRSLLQSRNSGRTMEQAILDLQRTPGAGPEESIEQPLTRSHDDSLPLASTPMERILQSFLAFDDRSAETGLADALWAGSIEDACFVLLEPVSRGLEIMSAEASAPPSSIRFGLLWIERKLLAAFDLSRPDTGRSRVFVAAMHDESAHIVALCHAVALSRAHYQVQWLGDDVSVPEICELMAASHCAAIVLGANSMPSATATRSAIARLDALRDSGTWSGLIAVVGDRSVVSGSAVHLPNNAGAAIEGFEHALSQGTVAIRMLRNE